MTKLLLIVAFTIVIVLWFKRSSGQRSELPRKQKAAEDMVRCELCQVNLPRSEAILSRGRIYCCDEHRLRGH